MTEQHDTREAVEAMAAALVSIHDRGWIAEEDCDRAADMLRRLLARAEAAEEAASEARLNAAKFHTLACQHKAALATARADALKEAAALMETRRVLYAARQRSAANVGNIAKLDHWHSRQSEAGEAYRAILSLIPAQETQHDR